MFEMIVRFLPPQLQKKAREELNEKPKSVEKDIQFIKEWLEKQPHLKAKTGNSISLNVHLTSFPSGSMSFASDKQ